MANAKIQNGTHSSWRTVRPRAQAWISSCGRNNAAHWSKCPDCKEPRPT